MDYYRWKSEPAARRPITAAQTHYTQPWCPFSLSFTIFNSFFDFNLLSITAKMLCSKSHFIVISVKIDDAHVAYLVNATKCRFVNVFGLGISV